MSAPIAGHRSGYESGRKPTVGSFTRSAKSVTSRRCSMNASDSGSDDSQQRYVSVTGRGSF